MSSILISEFQIRDCQFLGTTATLRLYCDDDWTDSLGVRHLAGSSRSVNSFYQEIACTLSGDVLTVPAFTTYSTLDARQNPNVRISGEIFDEAGTWRKTLFENWFIPLQTPTTRDIIEEANQGQALWCPSSSVWLAQWVQQYIDAVLGVLRFATSVIYGWVRLSKPADDVTDPVVVGANDFGGLSHAGIVELDIAPSDPLHPIAVGINSPLLTASVGRILAQGTATLASSGGISLDTVTGITQVALDSPILVLPLSDDVSGNLRPISRDAGVGFVIVSDNGLDTGDVAWFLYESI